jgi:hypothetical protein
MPVEERVRGMARIPTRGECEMILMVGLPSAGTIYSLESSSTRPDP